METLQLKTPEDLKRFFDVQREDIRKKVIEETQKVAEEIVETELDLLEFNLYISSFGKEKLDEATAAVQKIRKMEREGKINLKQYEDLAEDF